MLESPSLSVIHWLLDANIYIHLYLYYLYVCVYVYLSRYTYIYIYLYLFIYLFIIYISELVNYPVIVDYITLLTLRPTYL